MMSLSKERKERRLQSYDGMMMTRRGYNAALCGLLLYGIAANFIICKYFTDAVEYGCSRGVKSDSFPDWVSGLCNYRLPYVRPFA